jgi:hypothetical protein
LAKGNNNLENANNLNNLVNAFGKMKLNNAGNLTKGNNNLENANNLNNLVNAFGKMKLNNAVNANRVAANNQISTKRNTTVNVVTNSQPNVVSNAVPNAVPNSQPNAVPNAVQNRNLLKQNDEDNLIMMEVQHLMEQEGLVEDQLDENTGLASDDQTVALVNIAARIVEGISLQEELDIAEGNQAPVNPLITMRAEVIAYAQGVANRLGPLANDLQAQIINLGETAAAELVEALTSLFLNATELLMTNLQALIPSRESLFAVANFLFKVMRRFADNAKDAMVVALIQGSNIIGRMAQPMKEYAAKAGSVVVNAGLGVLDGAAAVGVQLLRGGGRVIARAGVTAAEAVATYGPQLVEYLRERLTHTVEEMLILGELLAKAGFDKLKKYGPIIAKFIMLALKKGSISLLRLGLRLLQFAFNLAAEGYQWLSTSGAEIAAKAANEIKDFIVRNGKIIAGMLRDVAVYAIKTAAKGIIGLAPIAAMGLARGAELGVGLLAGGVGILAGGVGIVAGAVAGWTVTGIRSLWIRMNQPAAMIEAVGANQGPGPAPFLAQVEPRRRVRNAALIRLLEEARAMGAPNVPNAPYGQRTGEYFTRGFRGGRRSRRKRTKTRN